MYQSPQAAARAKAIPVSELGKGHRQILIPTREASQPRISAVPSDTTAKLAIRQGTQQLGEHRAALVARHLALPADSAKRKILNSSSSLGTIGLGPTTTF
jgi:hypothetical protein